MPAQVIERACVESISDTIDLFVNRLAMSAAGQDVVRAHRKVSSPRKACCAAVLYVPGTIGVLQPPGLAKGAVLRSPMCARVSTDYV